MHCIWSGVVFPSESCRCQLALYKQWILYTFDGWGNWFEETS